jgi:hypothetical protein
VLLQYYNIVIQYCNTKLQYYTIVIFLCISGVAHIGAYQCNLGGDNGALQNIYLHCVCHSVFRNTLNVCTEHVLIYYSRHILQSVEITRSMQQHLNLFHNTKTFQDTVIFVTFSIYWNDFRL